MELRIPGHAGGDRRRADGARGGVRHVLAGGRGLPAGLRGRGTRPHHLSVGVAEA